MDLFGGAPGGVCFCNRPELAKPNPVYVSTGAPGGRVGKPSSGLIIRSVGPPPGSGTAKVGMRSPGLPTGACDDAGNGGKSAFCVKLTLCSSSPLMFQVTVSPACTRIDAKPRHQNTPRIAYAHQRFPFQTHSPGSH